jgi:hypothetical protein
MRFKLNKTINGGTVLNRVEDKKMTYKNLKELAAAAMDIDLKDTKQTQRMAGLIRVYFDAYNNPPEGIIGVGAISYAEYQLIKAQESTQ